MGHRGRKPSCNFPFPLENECAAPKLAAAGGSATARGAGSHATTPGLPHAGQTTRDGGTEAVPHGHHALARHTACLQPSRSGSGRSRAQGAAPSHGDTPQHAEPSPNLPAHIQTLPTNISQARGPTPQSLSPSAGQHPLYFPPQEPLSAQFNGDITGSPPTPCTSAKDLNPELQGAGRAGRGAHCVGCTASQRPREGETGPGRRLLSAPLISPAR